MSAGKAIAGLAAALVAAEGVFAVAANSSAKLQRPPGVQAEGDFMARCIKCGKCILACPYAALHVAGPLTGAAAGTPCIDAREQACRLCPDFPCVNACPTGAIRDVTDKRDPHMGYARIDEQVCIAYKGYRCEVCYRVCPLIDEAITIEFESQENDEIHAKFIERCAVSEPYVPIRIVTLAEDGSHKRGSHGTGNGQLNGSGTRSGSGSSKSSAAGSGGSGAGGASGASSDASSTGSDGGQGEA